MDPAELEDTTLQDQTKAINAECDRLRVANGNPLTYRAFESQHRLGVRRGISNFLGVEDRRFLSKKSTDSRLPLAQSSGQAYSVQRAIEIGSLSTVTEFLKDQPDSVNDIRNGKGETLLHTAVLNGYQEIVRVLLQHGADPNIELPSNGVSKSSLESVAPRSDNFRYSRMLNAAEATPVHYACAVGNLDIIKLLLAASLQYKKTEPFVNRRQGNLLVWAITAGHPDLVEYLLIRKKLEVDCFDEDGNNSIGIAALVLGKTERTEELRQILKVLVRSETIDINHKNMYGLTPYDMAEEPHVKELIERLGGRTARVMDMERLFRWDRERSREEYTYRRDRPRAIQLRNRDTPTGG